MNEHDEYRSLSGALYLPSPEGDLLSIIACRKSIELCTDGLINGWESFKFTSNVPWDDEQFLENQLSFKYQFWLRRGRDNRILLVATKIIFIKELFKALDLDDWFENTPNVNIIGLIEDFGNHQKNYDYSIGAMWARVEGLSPALKTIVLYGNDVTSTSLYKNNLSSIAQPYRIAIKQNRWKEVITIGEKGFISFPYRGASSLHEVDHILKIIGSDLNHLDWKI